MQYKLLNIFQNINHIPRSFSIYYDCKWLVISINLQDDCIDKGFDIRIFKVFLKGDLDNFNLLGFYIIFWWSTVGFTFVYFCTVTLIGGGYIM